MTQTRYIELTACTHDRWERHYPELPDEPAICLGATSREVTVDLAAALNVLIAEDSNNAIGITMTGIRRAVYAAWGVKPS